MHVGSRRIRSASVWLRAALFGGGMHLDVLFATQLVGILSRLSNRRVLTWSTRSGSPAQALHAWLLSRTSDWKWTHDITCHSLDLTVAGEPGARQHSVRDAWRAWCLQRHMSSLRRDADLDCFDEHGCFHRIDWEATRTFASSGPEARAISTGACFSPAALGGCVDGVAETCIWPGCEEHGTFDHIAWSCLCRPSSVEIPLKPGEFLSSRFGWDVSNSRVDMVAVQSWLVHVEMTAWSFIPIDCWLFVPSLSGLPLVPVLLALWSAVPSFVLHDAWPFGGAGAASAPLSGWPVLFVRFSFVWGWLGFWALVGGS